jgi:acetate---CoA ligase (ADP-forming)
LSNSMDVVAQLKPFFEPKSVAVVGANPNAGELAFNLVENLAQNGYRGKVYPVNPNYSEILGRKCYRNLEEIRGNVDLAVILTSRTVVPDIVKQCGEKGIRAAIVVGQGFAEAEDEEGKRLQQRVVEAARKGGVRVLGPNTFGSANAFINFSTAFLKQTDMRKWPVGVISQSGLFFGTIGRLRLIGKGIDVGNTCDVDIADALEYFEQDTEVKIIVLHIEGINDGKRFKEIAQRVAMVKPILAMKTGRSERAAHAAQSHTASLIGDDAVWDAVFKQCGIIRARSLDELGDLVRAFLYLPLMKGRGIAIATGSGGIGIMSMDACAEHNLEVVELPPGTRRRLKAMSPSWHRIGNPLDTWPIVMLAPRPLADTFKALVTEVLRDPHVDGLLFFGGAWFEHLTPPITQVIAELADTFPDKPLAFCFCEGWLYDTRARDLSEKLEQIGKGAIFSNPDDAIRALAGLADRYEFLTKSV